MPLACEYGKECYVSRYFDHSGPKDEKAADYTCGNLSAHKYASTDFILSDRGGEEKNVMALAADAGVVAFARDGLEDVDVRLVGEEAVRGRECGNGVVISHERGYSTQYCHLKKGSVLVKPGQNVERGDRVGDVGLSGNASFPHLKFTVLKNDLPVDPFTGEDPLSEGETMPCGAVNLYPLWDRKTEKRLAYVAAAVLDGGFSDVPPNEFGAAEGRFRAFSFSTSQPFLIFWSFIFGAQEGDAIQVEMYGPGGQLLKKDVRRVVAGETRRFQYVAARRPKDSWSVGNYRVDVIVSRSAGGYASEVARRSFSATAMGASSAPKKNNK
ncbi:MAG: M23 family metallopeptidase [Rickettsiales bacterium]